MIKANPVINQILTHPLFEEKEVKVSIKRLDLIHPQVSGNKFFKLKYNLERAKTKGKNTILTFGGAYSNHIASVAFAAKAEGLNSIGIIRGDVATALNPTLLEAQNNGMRLHYISRVDYREKNNPVFIEKLEREFGDFYLIPEGGTNELAITGTKEILQKQDEDFTHILCSIGTGGTFAGLYSSLSEKQILLGFSSLKGEFIHNGISDLIAGYQLVSQGSYEIFTKYHFGGYAKYGQELIDFIWWFYESFDMVLDPIYTGKMAFGIWDLIQKDYFPKGSKILMIHSGGLQGNVGFTERTGIKLPSLST